MFDYETRLGMIVSPQFPLMLECKREDLREAVYHR